MRNESTRDKVKRMMEGLMYHCTEMTDFMSKTVSDPYFDTEEGKRIQKCMIGILSNHVMAVAELMTFKEDVDEKPKFNLEDILKDSFN